MVLRSPGNRRAAVMRSGGRGGVRALIAVVACFVAVFWAWRVSGGTRGTRCWRRPGLGSGDAARRVEAVREVSDLGFGHSGESIRLLIPALEGRRCPRPRGGGRIAGPAQLERDRHGDRRGRGPVRDDGPDRDAEGPRCPGAGGGHDVGGRDRHGRDRALPEGRNPTAAKKGSAPLIDVDAVAAVLEGPGRLRCPGAPGGDHRGGRPGREAAPAGRRRPSSRPWTTSRPPIGRRRPPRWPATGKGSTRRSRPCCGTWRTANPRSARPAPAP